MKRLLLAALAISASAQAAEMKLLSAGAVGTGMKAVVAAFEKESGHTVKATFDTAPRIAARIEAGESFDVVIAPPAAMEKFARAGKVREGSVVVGRVGMGVAIRAEAPQPDVSTADAFQGALMEADSIVFNRASSGLYFEKLLKKRRLYEQLEPRITRYADGAAVMEHVIKGKGHELAIGPMTEIADHRAKGLRLVGPLPGDMQNYTSYVASATMGATKAAGDLLQYLAGPAARSALAAAGVE